MDPRQCHTFLVGGEGEQWRYLAISVVGAVLVVDLEGSSSQIPIVVSIPSWSQCDPVDLLFLRDADDFLYMSAACEGMSSLKYLSFLLDFLSTLPQFSLISSDHHSHVRGHASFQRRLRMATH